MSKTLALEASRQEFNAKEKSLQIRIEHLETISQHLEQKQASFSLDQLQDKVTVTDVSLQSSNKFTSNLSF